MKTEWNYNIMKRNNSFDLTYEKKKQHKSENNSDGIKPPL